MTHPQEVAMNSYIYEHFLPNETRLMVREIRGQTDAATAVECGIVHGIQPIDYATRIIDSAEEYAHDVVQNVFDEYGDHEDRESSVRAFLGGAGLACMVTEILQPRPNRPVTIRPLDYRMRAGPAYYDLLPKMADRYMLQSPRLTALFDRIEVYSGSAAGTVGRAYLGFFSVAYELDAETLYGVVEDATNAYADTENQIFSRLIEQIVEERRKLQKKYELITDGNFRGGADRVFAKIIRDYPTEALLDGMPGIDIAQDGSETQSRSPKPARGISKPRG